MKKLPLLITALFTASLLSTSVAADPLAAATKPVVMPNTPSGAGDPGTLVCRAPQRLPNSNRFGPKACGHNLDWLVLAMNGKDLAPDGKTLIDRPTVDNPTATVFGAASGAIRPKTELALACLLGMGLYGCQTVFVGASFNEVLNNNTRPLTKQEAGSLISDCTEEYVHRMIDNCPLGPLETVQYLGTNVRGDDVYVAIFMHQENTYVISPPTPGGKISAFWRFSSSPIWVFGWRRNVVDLKAPVLAPRTIYSAVR